MTGLRERQVERLDRDEDPAPRRPSSDPSTPLGFVYRLTRRDVALGLAVAVALYFGWEDHVAREEARKERREALAQIVKVVEANTATAEKVAARLDRLATEQRGVTSAIVATWPRVRLPTAQEVTP